MEAKKTTRKTAGGYKKPESITVAQTISPAGLSQNGPRDSDNKEDDQSPEVQNGKALFGTIKETLHGETDRKKEEFIPCEWAIPEDSKKKSCTPVNCNDAIILQSRKP